MSKQVLDVQQMQHLQELGLKLDYNTMLSWIVDDRDKDKTLLCISSDAVDYVDFSHYCLPAYTLQDVLDALPTEIRLGQKRCWLAIDVTDETVGYYYEENVRISPQWAYFDVIEYGESLIDALYRLLCWAIENKFVETNKNE